MLCEQVNKVKCDAHLLPPLLYHPPTPSPPALNWASSKIYPHYHQLESTWIPAIQHQSSIHSHNHLLRGCHISNIHDRNLDLGISPNIITSNLSYLILQTACWSEHNNTTKCTVCPDCIWKNLYRKYHVWIWIFLIHLPCFSACIEPGRTLRILVKCFKLPLPRLWARWEPLL